MLDVLVREPYKLSLSLAEDVLSIISKPKATPICKTLQFEQTSAAPLLFAANTKAVVPYACRCEALDYCDPLHER